MTENRTNKRDNRIGGSVFYAIAIIIFIVTFFSARNVYRMWSWPSIQADITEIFIELDDEDKPVHYGEVKFEADQAVHIAEIEDPIRKRYKKGDQIKISYNPDNPSKVIKFSFFRSFNPLLWLAVAIGLSYVGKLVWNYKGKPAPE